MALFKNWPVEKQGGLGSLLPGKGRRGRTQTMPNFDWSQLLSGATPDFPGQALAAPPGAGFGLQQPTVVRPTEKRIPAQMKEFFGEPIRPRPPIGGPDGPMPPRPPGESIQAKIRQLQIQKRQLIQQIRQIDAQIHSLAGSRGFPIPWHDDTGGEPPPPPLNPPTIVRPPTIGPGTPIPQPPPMLPPPWKPDPPRGG